MSDERCELTELLVTDCAHCRHLAELPQEPLTWITAQFPGRCALKWSHEIAPGDRIANTEDGWICDRRHDA